MKILFVGESWVVHETHQKGFDVFTSVKYEEGGKVFEEALLKSGFEVEYMPCHVAYQKFPRTKEELKQYDVVILSDIGSNTFLLSHETFYQGKIMGNPLVAIKEYVAEGGAFAMMGGYLSFTGIDAKARYANSPIEEILPVKLLNYDDRYEAPEGIIPTIVDPKHPILKDIPQEWPHFLGYNILQEKEGCQVLARCNEHVFMAVREYGQGRTFAFASDIAPHWGSLEFVNWSGYAPLFANAMHWLTKKG